MKAFLPITLSILLFSACSEHNAFKEFNISKTKELSEDSIQTFKVKRDGKVDGIVSVIYLNKVFPQKYRGNEFFYVNYYIKDKNASVDFTLNTKPVLTSKELQPDNEFTYLTSFNAPWSHYYLLEFPKEGNVLKLKLKTAKAANATLTFIKDK